MIFRLLLGAGLIAVGYYVGRTVGRSELLDRKLHGKGRKRRVEGKVVDATEYKVTSADESSQSKSGRGGT
jgi:hypothetical protein